MKNSEKWLKIRDHKKKIKSDSLNELLSNCKEKKSYTRLSNLIELYSDAYDLVTKIGYEISIMSDDEGC